MSARRPQYYPAFLDLAGRRVVVVGGGAIASRKVQGLLPCGPALLVVIAPTLEPAIAEHAARGAAEWIARGYVQGDLEGAAIAFAATDDRAVNASVAREARARGIPVLAVDDVPNCDFIAPAVVRRGDLVVAISTGGRSPAMARRMREELERVVSPEHGRLLDVLADVRDVVRSRPDSTPPDTDRWTEALDEDVYRRVWAGDLAGARSLLESRLVALPETAANAGR